MTVKFAPPFLVMTLSYEAVISLTGMFSKCVYKVELKLKKFQRLSESHLGVILKTSRGHIDPQYGIGLKFADVFKTPHLPISVEKVVKL